MIAKSRAGICAAMLSLLAAPAAMAAVASANLDLTTIFLGETDDIFYAVDATPCRLAGCTRRVSEGNAFATASQSPLPDDIPAVGVEEFSLTFKATANAIADPIGRAEGVAEGLFLLVSFINPTPDPLSVFYTFGATLKTVEIPETGFARATGGLSISLQNANDPNLFETLLFVNSDDDSRADGGVFEIAGIGARTILIESTGVSAVAAEVPLPAGLWLLAGALGLAAGTARTRPPKRA